MDGQHDIAFPLEAMEIRRVRLLLVGRDHELEPGIVNRVFEPSQPWLTYRATSLPDGAERLKRDAIDVVLLAHSFDGGEIRLFASDARRNGFSGLILQACDEKVPDGAAKPPALGKDAPLLRPRDKDILAAVCKGCTNREVAAQLHCSESAVKAGLQRLFQETGVRNRARLVRLALCEGWVDDEGNIRTRPEALEGASELMRDAPRTG